MPSFKDTAVYPAFYDLPEDGPAVTPAGAWFMVAQIKENMTITKPTLIVTDRVGVDFAVTFEDVSFSLRGFRKGYTIVLPRARRLERGEGKKAVMKIDPGDCAGVKVIPSKLERVFELGEGLESPDAAGKCASCGTGDGSLLKCTGCASVVYCSKDCQVKGWSELGHKTDCKAFKAIKEIWP